MKKLIYFIISILLVFTYPLYAKYLSEAANNVIFAIISINMMISIGVFGSKRGAKPYLICGKCNIVFPMPESKLPRGRSSVYREFCSNCQKERMCYVRFYKDTEENNEKNN